MKLYSTAVNTKVNSELPHGIIHALSQQGWNAFGVYELVKKALAEEKKQARDVGTPDQKSYSCAAHSNTQGDKKMVKPVRPEDMSSVKMAMIPPEVIAAFNAVITKNFSGNYACFRTEEVQKEILDRMMEAGCEKSRDALRNQMFNEHWLDVEDIFREAGWEVRYDAPGYCETGPCTFEFRKKK